MLVLSSMSSRISPRSRRSLSDTTTLRSSPGGIITCHADTARDGAVLGPEWTDVALEPPPVGLHLVARFLATEGAEVRRDRGKGAIVRLEVLGEADARELGPRLSAAFEAGAEGRGEP